MKSLLLDRTAWDLVLDANGNIAATTAPYSRAQDVACACRLFTWELWYDLARGIPYYEEILGHWPPLPLLKARLVDAALSVPGVKDARAIITLNGREAGGQIQFTSDSSPAVYTLSSVGDVGSWTWDDSAIWNDSAIWRD